MAFGYYNCRLDVVIIIAKFTKICIQAMREVLLEAEINLISPMCKHIDFLPPHQDRIIVDLLRSESK